MLKAILKANKILGTSIYLASRFPISFEFSSKINKKVMDGNEASAHVAYHLSDVASIYPITPSSTMSEKFESWTAEKIPKKNIFGQVPSVKQMQSEGGAIGALHGLTVTGALSTSFTSSQGLMLMLPTMCKIAGELRPTVIHVASRALSYQSLSIAGDHEDITFVRETGFGMISSSTVQECMDLGTITHLSAYKSSLPFVHFFEGFKLSHLMTTIQPISMASFKKLVDMKDIMKFKNRSLTPFTPMTIGHGQNTAVLFQNNEASNIVYEKTPDIIEDIMRKFKEETGREYHLYDYHGDPEAQKIIVVMGAASPIVIETVKHLNERGHKVGVIVVRLYRPFSPKHFLRKLPKTVKSIAVLDRTKSYSGMYEPLFGDISFIIQQNKMKNVDVVGGRYGIGGKDISPEDVKAIFHNLGQIVPANGFTIGIHDDVTHKSLSPIPLDEPLSKSEYNMILYGLGSDGTVSASKGIIKLISDQNLFANSLSEYSADKSYSTTTSFISMDKKPVDAHYRTKKAQYVGVHKDNFLLEVNVANTMKKGGILFLNTSKTGKELNDFIPAHIKRTIAEKNLQIYTLDCYKIDQDLKLEGKISFMFLASMFKLTKILGSEEKIKEKLFKLYKDEFEKKVKKELVNQTEKAIALALKNLKKFNYNAKQWLQAEDKGKLSDIAKKEIEKDIHVKNFFEIQKGKGAKLPVSAFTPGGNGPTFTSRFEKKGYNYLAAQWTNPKACVTCNRCSFICPRGCIRLAISFIFIKSTFLQAIPFN